ncbi:MAG: type II toxin-antitoxin system RelE/ParE family toxin [Oscillospiraceae bacterium]|nr:type II toxin-antitoxin system RelE/ParE family toxin [Oscillospiraceae bacterium]
MKYEIKILKRARKFIEKQNPTQRKRLVDAINQLPFAGDIVPLANRSGVFRLRVGGYRVIYSIEQEILTIFILTAGNRGDIY